MAEVFNLPNQDNVVYMDRYRERLSRSWGEAPADPVPSLVNRLTNKISQLALRAGRKELLPAFDELDPTAIGAISVEQALADYTFPDRKAESNNITYLEFPDDAE